MKRTSFEYLTQLTFLPRFFPVNVYLVEETDSLTLVDAGLPYSAKGILKQAERMGKPIRRIALTHAHSDHVGSLDDLLAALPGVELSLSKRDARFMEGDRSVDSHEVQKLVKGGMPTRLKARPNRFLNPGDRVGSLEVISSPGHTPGHISFLDVRNRNLIAGDAMQTRGGIAVAGVVKPLFPFPVMGTWDLETAWNSAKLLLDLHPACLAVGHGRMLKNPEEAMKRAIAEAESVLLRKGGFRASSGN